VNAKEQTIEKGPCEKGGSDAEQEPEKDEMGSFTEDEPTNPGALCP
jgi:hypothetical protein